MARQRVRLGAGRELSADVVGLGHSQVVLLAGFMAGASEWSAVQRHLGTGVRSVSYDRAGYGGSSDPTQPPTEVTTLDDLISLLDALDIPQAVFVAHSWGGTLLRLLASRHPDRVAGLCLVDATRSDLISARQMRLQSLSLRLMMRLAPLGIAQAATRRMLAAKLSGMEAAEQQAFLADSADVRTLRAGLAEKDGMRTSGLAQLADLERQGLPDVPVTFIVGRRPDAGARRVRSRMLAGHLRESSRHPQARYVVAEDSGHLVPQQQPDLVAREVLDLIGGQHG
jgi:pimeloyl-ACP methyl ester carboxylesterase